MTITILDNDDPDRVIAVIELQSGFLTRRSRTIRALNARSLLEALRAVPRDVMEIDAFYPLVGNKVEFNNNELLKGKYMDLAKVVALREERTTREDAVAKSIFVAPAPRSLPDDGVLTFSTVESVFDLKNVPENGVALFSTDAIPVLKCVNDNSKLFGVELKYLAGLAEADYTVAFDSAAYGLDRFSYSALVADLQHAAQMAAMQREQTASVHDREVARSTRADGSSKRIEADRLGDLDPTDDDASTEFRL